MILTRTARRHIRQASTSVKWFARRLIGIDLYPYQLEAADAIVDSVLHRRGRTFVLIFSRQSGKDETLANVFLFLMCRFYEIGCEIVCAQPTFKPQTVTAMERLRKRGYNLGRRLQRTAGYIMRLGQARVSYFSAEPTASQLGATAERLLVMNEAQDIEPAIYDKRFSPMAAAGYATKVFSGTSWTSNTLLSREKRACLEQEKIDGVKRVFLVDADHVGRFNPLYKLHVRDELLKHGRNHPFIRTQYYCEEIDAQAGMFNAGRLALMIGDQPAQDQPVSGTLYAFLLDVAGQDEAIMNGLDAPLINPGRDAVSLSIASVDLSSLEFLQVPTYRIVNRQQWVGQNHVTIFGKLKAMAEAWTPQWIVIDATGVGEGLWAMLDKAFPLRVIPVKFTQQTKSEVGWKLISIIETGRLRDCTPSDKVRAQYAGCQSEILPGPAKTLRWGVPEGSRDVDGDLLHDDYVLADALVSQLDGLDWYANTEFSAIDGEDPLKSIGDYYV